MSDSLETRLAEARERPWKKTKEVPPPHTFIPYFETDRYCSWCGVLEDRHPEPEDEAGYAALLAWAVRNPLPANRFVREAHGK